MEILLRSSATRLTDGGVILLEVAVRETDNDVAIIGSSLISLDGREITFGGITARFSYMTTALLPGRSIRWSCPCMRGSYPSSDHVIL